MDWGQVQQVKKRFLSRNYTIFDQNYSFSSKVCHFAWKQTIFEQKNCSQIWTEKWKALFLKEKNTVNSGKEKCGRKGAVQPLSILTWTENCAFCIFSKSKFDLLCDYW